jgi:Family of unknown function (DUF6055)
MLHQMFILILVLFCYVSFGVTKDDDLKQALDNHVSTFLGVDSLSPRQQAGFYYQLALIEIYDQLSPQLQQAADLQIQVQAPVRQFTILSPSGHFALHYDTSTPDAVPTEDISGNGIPDYIDSAAVILDEVWQKEIDDLGFMAPLNVNGEPVSAYHIYFSNIPYYGLTSITDAINDQRPDNWTSYIELNHTMQGSEINTEGLDGVRVTVAHEFNHAIQLSYRFWNSDRYFFEMTGSWIEDIIYPDVNDYFFYLSSFFNNAQNIAFTSQVIEYAYSNALYLHMLSQIYGNEIVVEIWQQILVEKALDAIKTVLARHNTTFSKSLNEYAKWLYFTGERAIPGEFFVDAAYFDMITVPEKSMLQSNLIIKHNFQVSRESFYYFTVDSVFALASLAEIDAGINNDQIRLNYFNSEKNYTTSFTSGVSQPVIIESVPQNLVFAVSNIRDSTININFTMLTDSTIIPRAEAASVAYGPNPTYINTGVKNANFWAVPAFAKILILDFNQQPVRELQNDEYFDTPVSWDLKDKNGNLVSSGIYFYIVTGQKTQINKIAIIR